MQSCGTSAATWQSRGMPRRQDVVGGQHGRECVLQLARAGAEQNSAKRLSRDVWSAPALLALLAALLVSPSSIDGQAMREQRYCFNLGDGVCDEGPYTEAPCAVGSDEYDCRRQVGHVQAEPYGNAWQAGRIVDVHDGRWPTTWRSAEISTQSVTIELDRPRCLATLRIMWWDTFSARDYLVMHSLDGETWSVLFRGDDVARGYGNRVDDWELPTLEQMDGTMVGTTGRMRFLRLDLAAGHGAHYELQTVDWTEDDALCPACNVCAAVVLNGEASTCTLVTTPSGAQCAYTAASDPDGIADTGDEVEEACNDALMDCAACTAQGCAWCDEPSGASCKPDTAGSCLASSNHTSSWRTPETLQRRTCAGECDGEYCNPESGYRAEWLEVATYTDPPFWPAPVSVLPAPAKRAGVPRECAAFELPISVDNAVASSTHASENFALAKLFDGETSEIAFQNVWEIAAGCLEMTGDYCTKMEPQWVRYDFGQPQAICSYAMRSRKKGTLLWMSPKSWNFEGSNDGYHWITISQVRNEDEWEETADDELPQLRTYDPGLAVFRWYRLYFTEVFGEGLQETLAISLQEMHFFAPLNECISDPLEYESAAPTDSSDRECTVVLQCTSLEYEIVAPTVTSDRECASLRFCQSFEYESVAATATSNRECTMLQTCPEGSYESVPPVWVRPACTEPSTTCYFVTDRTCSLLPNVDEFVVSRVYSDALTVQWSRPVIARAQYSYTGFQIYLNNINAKAVSALCVDGGTMCADATSARGGCPDGCTGEVAISAAAVSSAIITTPAAGGDVVSLVVEDTTIAAGQLLQLADAFGQTCAAQPKGSDLEVQSVLAAIAVPVASADDTSEVVTLAVEELSIEVGQALRLVNAEGQTCLAVPTDSDLIVGSVSRATCITTVVEACESATADEYTCTSAGACTFTAADGETPATCTTTVVPECAAANADVATCVAAGACTFAGAQIALVTDLELGDAPAIPPQACSAVNILTTIDGYDALLYTDNPAAAGFAIGDTVEILDTGGGACAQIADGEGPYIVNFVDDTSVRLSGIAAGVSNPVDPTLCSVGRPARDASTQCKLARPQMLTFATDLTVGDVNAATSCVVTRPHTCAGTASCILGQEGQAEDCPEFCDYDPGPDEVVEGNDFSQSLGLIQTLIGLETSTSYTIAIRTIWEEFGPSLADKTITQVTGPSVSPAGQGTRLWTDAMEVEWAAPASPFPIMGWVLYSRLAPYIVLDRQDCGGTAVDTPVIADIAAATVPACIAACDENLYCCGFRYDAETNPLQCTLVVSCTYECGPGCIGNFYKKQVAVRDDPRDVLGLHFDNDYRGSTDSAALVQGLRAGSTYDFWAVAQIVVDGELMESLPRDGTGSVMPSFQQMTVPAGTNRIMQPMTTLRRSDAIQVSWDAPEVPSDVIIDGYQVYYTDPTEDLGDIACVDDVSMSCEASDASCRSTHSSGSVMASGCCQSCAGVELFPDTPAVSSLDLFPRCGHCGVFVPAYPREMLVRGLSASTSYAFYMVPVMTDQGLAEQGGYPHSGLAMTALTFSEWTAPDVIAEAETTTLAFDSVSLSWELPTLPDDGADIVGYMVMYRRSMCGYFENSVALSTVYGANAFLGTGPITSAVIKYLPERNTEYDFVVVPIVADSNGLETICFPYVGGTEALPQEPTIMPLIDAQVVTAFYTGRTADVPGRPTNVVAMPAPASLEVSFDPPAEEGRYSAVEPLYRISLVPEITIYTVHCEAAGECVFAPANPYSGRAASCTAIATTLCEDADMGAEGVNVEVKAQMCEAAGGCTYTAATDPDGVEDSGDEVAETCWATDSLACAAVDLDLNVYIESSESPAVVTGLLNGVTYSIAVAAANEFGYGRDSITPSTGMPFSDCEPFVPFAHADATCHDGNAFGAVCEVECHVGFYQIGSTFYECQAIGEWQGDMQCLDVNECLSTPCANGGACRDSSDLSRPLLPFDTFICTCGFGYVGELCNEYLDPCLSTPCLNGGTCDHGSEWNYACACADNFQGDHCERCDPGWEGPDCTIDTNECASSPCYNDGTCFDAFNVWVCECRDGFGGPRCEENIDDCASSPCRSGICHDAEDAFTCECTVSTTVAYTGERCSNGPRDRCDDNPCAVHAFCISDQLSGDACMCEFGFFGDPFEECQDIDECASDPCGPGGTCVEPAPGSFECICRDGFDGAHCDAEIFDCISSPCANGGLCQDIVPGYLCACAAGFAGDTCEISTDECVSQPCLNGATCSDWVDEYSCFCQVGYSGGRCESELDLCLAGIDDCDPELSICTPTGPGTYSCICIEGFSSEDGYSCVDVDECAIDPCNSIGTRGCSESTVDASVPAGRFVCRCRDGFTGPLCEIDLDECIGLPCQNGGVCNQRDGYYTCTCTSGYDGYNCENESDECRSDPCAHGSCTDGVISYTCVCDAGWDGDNCAVDKDECASDPCRNGATCLHSLRGHQVHGNVLAGGTLDAYSCACAAGYAGLNCESDLDECSSSPCLNGGRCIAYKSTMFSDADAYTCKCLPGYDDEICGTVVNPCLRQTDDCDRVRSECTMLGPGEFECTCNAGWAGTDCSDDIMIPTLVCPQSLTVTNTDGTASGTVDAKMLLPGELADNDGSTPDLTMRTCVTGYNCVDLTPASFVHVETNTVTFPVGISSVELSAFDSSSGACDVFDNRCGAIGMAQCGDACIPTSADKAECQFTVTVEYPQVQYYSLIQSDTGHLAPYLGGLIVATATTGSHDQHFFDLRNSGTSTLHIDSVNSDVQWAFIFQGAAYTQLDTPIQLTVGQSARVGVLFHSTSAGVYSGGITVNSNDPFSSRLRIPLSFTVDVATTYTVLLPDTIPQQVMSPLEQAAADTKLYNVQESSVGWELLGCTGSSGTRVLPPRWFDGEVTVPPGTVDTSVAWLGALPTCGGILQPGAQQSLEVLFEAPYRAGMYTAAVEFSSWCHNPCPLVTLDGTAETCTSAGPCTHVAAVSPVEMSCSCPIDLRSPEEKCTDAGTVDLVVEACVASNPNSAFFTTVCGTIDMRQPSEKCASAGHCEYSRPAGGAFKCTATDALVCAARVLDGTAVACTCGDTPSGVPCVYTPADSMLGTAEACTSTDVSVCEAVDLTQADSSTCTNAGSCTHRAAVASSCTYVPPAASSSGALGSCVAADVDACASVELDGSEPTCTDAGLCTYTAKVEIVDEDCVAIDAADCDVTLDGDPTTCTNVVTTTGDACVHTPAAIGVLESCNAAHAAVCSNVELDGRAATCTSVGNCIHVAAVAGVAEACTATDIAVCAAASLPPEETCHAAGCSFTAPVAQVDEACVPVSPAAGCMIQDPACPTSSTLVEDTGRSTSMLEVSMVVQPGPIDPLSSTVHVVDATARAGQVLTLQIEPVDSYSNGGTANAIVAAGLEFVLELQGHSGEPQRFESYFDAPRQRYIFEIPLLKSGSFDIRVDTKWTGGTYTIPLTLGSAAEEMLDDCGAGANQVLLHSIALDFPNYKIPLGAGPLRPAAKISNVEVADLCAQVMLDGAPGTCTGVAFPGGCSHSPASLIPLANEACTPTSHPLTYDTSTLATGSHVTAGVAWTISQVPSYLDGLPYIQTIHSDVSSPVDTSDWLCFEIDEDATVYILHDNRAAGAPPAWLAQGFQKISNGGFISTVDGSGVTDTWDVYAAERSSGKVCLGGSNAANAQKMYIPVVGPHEIHLCTQTGVVRQMIGIRTADITVQPGAFVHDVYFTFLLEDAYHQYIADADLTIAIEAADDADTLVGSSGELSSKEIGTNSVTWKLRSWALDPCARVGMQTDECGDCVPAYDVPLCFEENSFWKTVKTPDLSDLLREVVDRPGWEAGNAVTFLIEASGASDAVNPAKLIVGETPTFIYSWGEVVDTKQVVVQDALCWPNSQLNALGSGCICIDGYHPGEDLKSCQPCPQGHYGAAETCTRCPDGKQPSADRTACEICTSDQAGRGGVCAQCESGRTSTIDRTSCTVCPVGFAGKDGVCEPCEGGTEPAHNQEECQACPPTHIGDGIICTICGPGTEPNAEQSFCVPCPAAHVGISGVCVRCDDGEAPNSYGTQCEPCPPGTAGLNGACTVCAAETTPTASKTDCIGCQTGTVSSGGICIACSNGFAGIDGSCEQCGNGKEPDEFQATCIPCAPGYAGRGGTCFQCGAGQMPSDDLSLCMSCPVGTHGTNGETCQACEPGQQPNLGRTGCDDCGFGLYSEDGTKCLTCDAGFEPTKAHDACTQCVGEYSVDGRKCLPCRPHERPNSLFGATSCVQCKETGDAAIGFDGVECTDCSPGHEPGHWTGASNTMCVSCAARGLDWFSRNGQQCSQCPAGSEPNAERTGCVFCMTTGTNTFTPATDECAPVGMELGACGCVPVLDAPLCSESGPTCIECAPGKEPLADRTGCMSCAEISDAHVSADGSNCIRCPPGTQANADLSGCERCPLNTVSLRGSPCEFCHDDPLLRRYLIPDAEQLSCLPCPDNTYFIADTHGCHVCKPGFTLNPDRSLDDPCVACGMGEVGVDGTCTRCRPGLYANAAHTQCLECGNWEDLDLYHPFGLVGDADGYIGVDGVCERCGPGTAPGAQTPVDDVLEVVRDDVHTECAFCALGRFSDDGTECKLCEPAHEPNQMSCMPESHWQTGMPPFDVAVDSRTESGFGAPGHNGAVMTLRTGATGCVRCLAGWYSPGFGEFCSSCPMGQQPNTEQTACENCGPGKVSGDGRIIDGQVSGDGFGRLCLPCPPGTQPNEAHDRCIPCEDQISVDGMACISCRLGQFPEFRLAATRCLQCADQHDSSYGANGISCETCEPGSEPDHFHEARCAPIPGTVACPGIDGYCMPAGSQCIDGRGTSAQDEAACALVPGLKACQLVPRLGSAPWFHHDNGRTSVGDCVPVDAPCPADTHNDNSGCLACEMIADNVYSTEGAPCRACVPGKQPNGMRTECLSCALLGDNLISPSGSPCVSCTAGFEPNLERTECLACTAGQYSSHGVSCGPCSPGEQPSDDATGCVACSTLTDIRSHANLAAAGASVQPVIASMDSLISEAIAAVGEALSELVAINDGAHPVLAERCEDTVDACDGYEPGTDGIPSTCPSGCTLVGLPGVNETCNNTVADCVTGYVPGNLTARSDSCPEGCTLTPAVPESPGVPGLKNLVRQIEFDMLVLPDPFSASSDFIPGDTMFSLDGRQCLSCFHGMTPDPFHTTCVRCSEGRAGTFGVCKDCEPGKVPNTLQTNCVPCEAGKYNPEYGKELCMSCFSEGLHIPSFPGTSCISCGNGTVPVEPLRHTTAASEGCRICEPGWAGVLGVCAPCPGGHRNSPDHTQCDRCPPGTVSAEGIECSSCRPGTRPNPKQTACDLCPEGRYSPDGLRCIDCWPLSVSREDRTWCLCAPGSEDIWEIPANETEPVASCRDINECLVNNGGCDESTQCYNLSPGRFCGGCPIGYFGEFYSLGYSILEGNTTCVEPPVDEGEDILSPELKLMMDASAEVLTVQVAPGNEICYEQFGVRATSTIVTVDRGEDHVTVDFADGAKIEVKLADMGQGISLRFADGETAPTESQQLLSPERLELETGLITDLAMSLGINESNIQITSIINPRARRLMQELGTTLNRRLQSTIGVEVTFIVISDIPSVFDDLNNQLADPNSTLLTSSTAGGIYRDQFFNLSDGLEVFEFSCTDRLVHDEKTDTCLPCPAGTEFHLITGDRTCEPCPVGRWSPVGGWCTDCPPHEYTPSYGPAAHIWCYRCDPGYTVNATSSGCDACDSHHGYYNSDGRDCTRCEPGTRPERKEAARYCVSCQVDGPRHYSSRGLYRDRTVVCTATASDECLAADIGGDDLVWARSAATRDDVDTTVACVASEEQVCNSTDLKYSWRKYTNRRLEGCTVDGCVNHGSRAAAEQACIALDNSCGGILENPSGSWQTRTGVEPQVSEIGQNCFLKETGVLDPQEACESASGGGVCGYTAYAEEVLEKCEATVEHPRTGLRGDMRVCGGGPGTCRGCSAYSPRGCSADSSIPCSSSCVSAGVGLPGSALNCEYTPANSSDPDSTDSCIAKAASACAAIDLGDPRVNDPNDKRRCELAGEEPGVCTYTPFLPTVFEACTSVEMANCSLAELSTTNQTADSASCNAAGNCTLWTASRHACETAGGGNGACTFTDEPRSCVATDQVTCADANIRRDVEAYTFDTPNRTLHSQNETCLLAGVCSYTSEISAVTQPLECDEMCGAGSQVNTTSSFTSCERCSDVGPRHISPDGTPCVTCPPGRQANDERTHCFDCPAGKYSDQAENGWHCRACPPGWEPNTRIAAWACMPCRTNHYSAGDRCHHCVENTVTQTHDGMVIASPAAAEQCRCPDGTYDSAVLGGGRSHIYCWDDSTYTALPWLEPSNRPSEKDVADGNKCIACPRCVECDGGVPRVRAGYHVGGTDGGNFSTDLMLLSERLLRADRHVYRCPRPELCLGEVASGCDMIDCTPMWYEAETGHAVTSTRDEFTRTDHLHEQAEHIETPPLLAARLGSTRCASGFGGRFCLGMCVDGEAGSRFCDISKCSRTDWSLVYVSGAVAMFLLGLAVACCHGQQISHDARAAQCCSRAPKDSDDPDQTRPCRVHGLCSVATCKGVAAMLLKPLGLLWPRLRVALTLLMGLYQILSSLSPVLALPLPTRAWAFVEFFAPIANLDVTLIPSIGCGMGFYRVMWIRLLTVAGMILPVWVICFVRTQFNCIETLRTKNGGTLSKKQNTVHPQEEAPVHQLYPEGEVYQDRRVLAMFAKRRMRNHKLREGAANWTFCVIFLGLPSIVRTMLQLYDCRRMDDGSSHLVADVNVVCSEPRPSDSDDLMVTGSLDPLYGFHLSVASAVLAACAALPTLAGLRLWHLRNKITDGLKVPALSPLYLHCKPSCFLWEIVSIFGRALLCGGLIVWERGSVMQLGAGVLLSSMLSAAVLWIRPLDSGPRIEERQLAATKELLAEAKVAVKTASANAKKLRIVQEYSKRKANETLKPLNRKQRKEAARLVRERNVVVAGVPQRKWDFKPAEGGVVEVVLARFDGLQTLDDKAQAMGRNVTLADYWAQQVSREVQESIVDELNSTIFAGKGFRQNKKGVEIKNADKKYPEYEFSHLKELIAQESMKILLEEAVQQKRDAKLKLYQLQRRLWPSGAAGGRLANVALAVCMVTVTTAYLLCLVLKAGTRYHYILVVEGYFSTSSPDTSLLQLRDERPEAMGSLDEIAGLLLLLIQIPPLVVLGAMVLMPLRADCKRASATRKAVTFKPAVAPEPVPEDESRPVTADSEPKVQDETWPEKDEETDISRSRVLMENAFDRVGAKFGRKRPEGKYITASTG